MRFLILLPLLLTTACATATRGTNERIQILSKPAGAQAISNIKSRKTVTFSDGTQSNFYGCSPTPCGINLPRKSSPVVEVAKQGYQSIKFKLVSTWESGPSSVQHGAIVAGTTEGSHVIAGKADFLKRIPTGTGLMWSGVFSLGMAPVADIALGSNRSLSPNPVSVVLAPNTEDMNVGEPK